jgi:hypothetical protein
MNRISPYLKAIVAGLIAFVGTLVTASADGHLDLAEWLGAILSGLVAVGAVWGVPPKVQR